MYIFLSINDFIINDVLLYSPVTVARAFRKMMQQSKLIQQTVSLAKSNKLRKRQPITRGTFLQEKTNGSDWKTSNKAAKNWMKL